MQRIANGTQRAELPTRESDVGTPGYFQNCNGAEGVPGTVIDAEWSNAIQEEVIRVIAWGLPTAALNGAVYTQLRDAIQSGVDRMIDEALAEFTEVVRQLINQAMTNVIQLLPQPPAVLFVRPGAANPAANTYPDIAAALASIERFILREGFIIRIDLAGTFTDFPQVLIRNDNVHITVSAPTDIVVRRSQDFIVVAAQNCLLDGANQLTVRATDRSEPYAARFRVDLGSSGEVRNLRIDGDIVCEGGNLTLTGSITQRDAPNGLWALGGDIEIQSATPPTTLDISVAAGGNGMLAQNAGVIRMNGVPGTAPTIRIRGGAIGLNCLSQSAIGVTFDGQSRLLELASATPIRCDNGDVRGVGATLAAGAVKLNNGIVLAGAA